MKQCPFCKEEIRDDAIKCRYCQSSFAMEKPSSSDDRRVTYIVDTDLIRFGKFAASVLAIFVIVGLYLFGIDLKKTAEELHDAKSALNASRTELRDEQSAVTASRSELQNLGSKLENLERSAVEIRNRIEQRGQEVDYLWLQIRTRALSPDQEQKLAELRKERPEDFAKGGGKRFVLANAWPAGKTLHIRFLDGTPSLQSKIREVAVEWTKYANLKFEFDNVSDAEIRITVITAGESWSYLGTQALVVPKDQPTMALGAAEADISTVRHEFGHVLGLIHEFQNPNAKIPWNRDAVYRKMAQQSWDKATTDANLLEPAKIANYRPYDRYSIMEYPISKDMTKGGFEVGRNTVLSQSDKDFARQIYPF